MTRDCYNAPSARKDSQTFDCLAPDVIASRPMWQRKPGRSWNGGSMPNAADSFLEVLDAQSSGDR
jgi:hypothetical protein